MNKGGEPRVKKVVMPNANKKTVKARGSASSGAQSGAGMDRAIEKKRDLKKPAMIAAGLVIVIALLWQVLGGPGGRALKVDGNKITISTVSKGIFEDFIPVRGTVEPLKTVFLDPVQGGRVEEILVEDGAILEPGDVIVRLSNSDLQLNVMGTEARILEQLNQMRDSELRLEQNRLGHRRELNQLNYQINVLERQIEREKKLLAGGHINESLHLDNLDQLGYLRERREITLETQASDEELRSRQLAFNEDKSKQLEGSLTFARQSLEELSVRASVGGKLSGFDLEIGQSIVRGERLGQIDDPDRFKLSALVDEFYLGRVRIGQEAVYERSGDGHTLNVSKIYPRVENGQFEVDLQFEGDMPSDVRRGQTIPTRLTLGDAIPAVLIPAGAFYQDTGGNWIFVVTEDGSQAVRRDVRLGRRNSRYIEVLEGLEVGEKVVTSPYSSYRDMDRLKLSDG